MAINNPEDISAVEAYWYPEDSSTVTLSGVEVTSIASRGGAHSPQSDYTLNTTSTGTNVTIGSNSYQSELDTLRFDGGKYLETSGSPAQTQTFSLYVVYKVDSAGTSQFIVCDAATTNPCLLVNSAGGFGASAGTTLFEGAADTSWHTHYAELAGASSSYDVDDGTPVTGDAGANTIDGFAIGASGGASFKMTGDVVLAVLVNGTLTAQNKTDLGDWLTNQLSAFNITEPTAARVYQRNNNQYTFPLTGSYDVADTPAGIEIRAVDVDSATVKDWTRLTSESISSGTWSGDFICPEHNKLMHLEARHSDDTGQTYVGVNDFGVGAVFDFWGQSLNFRMFDDYGSTGTPNVNACRLRTVNSGTYDGPKVWEKQEDVATGDRGIGEIVFIESMITELGVVTGAVCQSVGAALSEEAASPAGHWGDGVTDRSPYDTAITEAGNLYDSELEGIILDIGQNDSTTSVDSTDLWAAIKEVVEDARAALTNRSSLSNLPFYLPLMGDSNTYGSADGFNRVNNGRIQAAETLDNVYMVGVKDLTLADTIHNDAAGATNRAQRLAQLIAYKYQGPKVTAVTHVNSTTFDLMVTHSGGTDLAGTTYTGFTAKDPGDGAAITVSSAARQDANTIRLTVPADTPPNTLFSYMAGNTPTNTTPVLDNNATEAMPLLDFIDISTSTGTASSGGFTILDTLNNDAAFSAIFS